ISCYTLPLINSIHVVIVLVIINVVLLDAMIVIQKWNYYTLVEWFEVFYFDSPNFKIWQIVTYMFMHAGFAHIFFNMFALFMFGSALEYIMGSKRFLNFYLLTGLGALALQFIVQAVEVYSIAGSITIDPN